MTELIAVQWQQIAAWMLALLQLIIGLSILALNAKNQANRYTAFLLLLIAINSYAIGQLGNPVFSNQAIWLHAILAASAPTFQAILVLVIIALIQPIWLRRRLGWFWQTFVVLGLSITVITVFDLVTGTNIWFSLSGTDRVRDGITSTLTNYAGGLYASPIQLTFFVVIPLIQTVLLIYFGLIDRTVLPNNRLLARLLLLVNLIALAFLTLAVLRFGAEIPAVAYNGVISLGITFAIFQQMNVEGRIQSGRLYTRLIILQIIVALPITLVLAIYLASRAGAAIRQTSSNTVQMDHRAALIGFDTWLRNQRDSLTYLAVSPEISGLVDDQQLPYLKRFTEINPAIQFTSTTDQRGINLARSDGGPLVDYRERVWFQELISGQLFTQEIYTDAQTGRTLLILAVPILGSDGVLNGSLMAAIDSEAINSQLFGSEQPERSVTYLLDRQEQLVTLWGETQAIFTSELVDIPPVKQAIYSDATSESGNNYFDRFINAEGSSWLVIATPLTNALTVITLMPENDIRQNISMIQIFFVILVLFGACLLGILTWFVIHQATRPLRKLKDATVTIASGDLTRVAPVESNDEVGALARALNTMTSNFREITNNLERQISHHNQENERRSMQIKATGEVARQAAEIRSMDILLTDVVDLISANFGYYHAGLFLIDESRRYAILQAASSPGGKQMMINGHRLPVGEAGIVGHVAATGTPRIAMDVGVDPVYFNNPFLPETRSEMALPLSVRETTIGVLDVQSKKSSAFTVDDQEILQILADQIALAIANARLYAQAQDTLQQIQQLYQKQVSQAWQKRLSGSVLMFEFDRLGVHPIHESKNYFPPEDENDPHLLRLPLEFRGLTLGHLQLKREQNQPIWTDEDKEIVKTTLAQVSLTLENARLQEESQRRFSMERRVGQIIGKTEGLINVEAVLRTVVQEIGETLGDAHVKMRLVSSNAETVESPVEEGG